MKIGKWVFPITKLTKEQAAIIGAYTGFLAGNFADIQELGDKVMGYPTFTHQYASKDFAEELHEKVKPLFIAMCAESEK